MFARHQVRLLHFFIAIGEGFINPFMTLSMIN